MVLTSGACENHLNCSINCLCAEKQYLKERLAEEVTPSCCNYTKSSGQLALSAMWHCWCLCERLHVLTVGDQSLIYIIVGLVINQNGLWEDPIKIWSEIWSSPLSSLFICSCIGTLEIIGILILLFFGEISNFGTAHGRETLQNLFTRVCHL